MTGEVLNTKAYDNNPYERWVVPLFAINMVIFLYYAASKKFEPALVFAVPLFFMGRKIYQAVRDPAVGATKSTPMSFSDTRLIFGPTEFLISDIEVIAVYLNSYDGFKFAIGGGPGMYDSGKSGYGTEDGNGSQFSIRTKDQMIHDYNFYLSDFEQFSLMRRLMIVWQDAGVTVKLEQAYTDEYMLRQMTRYGS